MSEIVAVYVEWRDGRFVQVNRQPSRKSGRKRNGRVHRVADRDGWSCHYCDVSLGYGEDVERPTIDHRVPSSRGGHNRLSNLVLACHACNNDKADRKPREWLGRACCPAH